MKNFGERLIMFQLLAQNALNALQLGSVYALIALGYTMVYGILTMINFAHGDIFMVGTYLSLAGALLLLGLPFHLPMVVVFLGALTFSMVLTALLGVTIERLAYRPLRRPPGSPRSSPPWAWDFSWNISPWASWAPSPGTSRASSP